MREARQLQATDPVAAGEVWADVDRQITYFVSETVGNVQLHAQVRHAPRSNSGVPQMSPLSSGPL
jgi:hypothetical protein